MIIKILFNKHVNVRKQKLKIFIIVEIKIFVDDENLNWTNLLNKEVCIYNICYIIFYNNHYFNLFNKFNI